MQFQGKKEESYRPIIRWHSFSIASVSGVVAQWVKFDGHQSTGFLYASSNSSAHRARHFILGD